jgi:DNA-binding NarL/FixJ family response regulator
MNSASPVTVLHVEDDPLWADFCRALFRRDPGIRWLGPVATGAAALAATSHLHPDIVLLDVNLPDGDGFALARQIVAQGRPVPKLLLLSARDDQVLLSKVRDTDFHGLLWKNRDIESELPQALAELARGGRYFPAEVRRAWSELRARPDAFFKILSTREIDLLPYFSRGLDDDAIARLVGGSPLTVKSHRQHIMSKLGLHRSAELIHWTIKAGFGTSDATSPAPQRRVGANGGQG